MTIPQANEPELDIVIPVYNESENIVAVLDSFKRHLRVSYRVLICYDYDEDDTLVALRTYPTENFTLKFVKNRGNGVLGAVVTGFEDSTAPEVLVYPADDDYNAPQINLMMEKFHENCEIVVASRFVPGGCMTGCPWLKAALVRCSAWTLHYLARLPTRDPTNGLRIFSRRVLDTIPIESKIGFAFSFELLVKCHRLGWRVGEVSAAWIERRQRKSRFRVLQWVPQYLEWFVYAFATTYLFRGPGTVILRPSVPSMNHVSK